MNKLLIVFCFICHIYGCSELNDNTKSINTEVNHVNNLKPKHIEKFVSLKKIKNIPLIDANNYLIKNVAFINVDENQNVYILDRINKSIFVFDKNFNFQRELNLSEKIIIRRFPESLYIKNGVIYLYLPGSIQKWDINGEYISSIKIKQILNSGIFKPFEDFFIGYSFTVDKSDDNVWVWNLSKYSKNLEHARTIDILEIDRYKDTIYDPYSMLITDSENNLYFPGDRNEYKVKKYDIDGNLLFSFNRIYKRVPYSRNVTDYFNKIFKEAIIEKEFSELTGFPPFIRCMYVDHADNLWVLVGESYTDVGPFSNLDIISTIDIFSNKGKFLYTFKSNLFGYHSYLWNNKLFVSPINEYESNIQVFEIVYDQMMTPVNK